MVRFRRLKWIIMISGNQNSQQPISNELFNISIIILVLLTIILMKYGGYSIIRTPITPIFLNLNKTSSPNSFVSEPILFYLHNLNLQTIFCALGRIGWVEFGRELPLIRSPLWVLSVIRISSNSNPIFYNSNFSQLKLGFELPNIFFFSTHSYGRGWYDFLDEIDQYSVRETTVNYNGYVNSRSVVTLNGPCTYDLFDWPDDEWSCELTLGKRNDEDGLVTVHFVNESALVRNLLS